MNVRPVRNRPVKILPRERERVLDILNGLYISLSAEENIIDAIRGVRPRHRNIKSRLEGHDNGGQDVPERTQEDYERDFKMRLEEAADIIERKEGLESHDDIYIVTAFPIINNFRKAAERVFYVYFGGLHETTAVTRKLAHNREIPYGREGCMAFRVNKDYKPEGFVLSGGAINRFSCGRLDEFLSTIAQAEV